MTAIIKNALEASGLTVDIFNKPEEALSKFKKDYYVMIITDIRMPGMNGFELYREVKKMDSKIKFAFMTAFHLAHPNLSEGIVRSIPLVGPSVLKNNYLKNGVALQSLNASHQTIQGNREVLVVTGVAQNQNPVVIREVRIAGQLYNLEGKKIEQQTIWIGNAISPRIIRGMTLQDVSDLQRLKPLKTFELPPGDSIPFTIVFLKSTKEIKNFSALKRTADAS